MDLKKIDILSESGSTPSSMPARPMSVSFRGILQAERSRMTVRSKH